MLLLGAVALGLPGSPGQRPRGSARLVDLERAGNALAVDLHEMPADQSLRSAVATGMRSAKVAELPDDLLEDMCAFGKSLPFARTYVIVMPTGVESVMEKARKLCLQNLQLVPAFHKPTTLDDLPAAERALFSEDALRSLTTGEIAIHISHRKAVEQCRNDNVSSCLIFEEDFVSGGPDLTARWKASFEHLPNSWEFLFMGRCWDVQCDRGGLGADMYRVPHDGMTPQCFHSYAVNKRGAENLLHGMSLCRTLGKCPVDKAVQALVSHGEVYTVSPSLFTQSAIQRILEKSSSQLSGDDMARMEVSFSATDRPVFVPECWMPDLGSGHLRLPSSHVRMRGGLEDHYAQGNDVNQQMTKMLMAANRGVRAEARTPACEQLSKDKAGDGVSAFFKDMGWQPNPLQSSVFIALQACALETVEKQPSLLLSDCRAKPDFDDYTAPSMQIWRTSTKARSNYDKSKRDMMFRCPLSPDKDEQTSKEVLGAHWRMASSGFDWPSSEPLEIPESQGAFFETSVWPKPVVCLRNQTAHQNMRDRAHNPRLMKFINHVSKMEFRPVLKAGSTTTHHILRCLQPGQWAPVHQDEPLPSGYQAVALVRNPIDRFAAALSEVMVRTFLGQCPEGQCDWDRDKWNPKRTPVAVKAATRWYPYAKAVFDTSGPSSEDSLVHLVRAAVEDASCNIQYYASEHFASQSDLLVQGSTDGASGQLFQLEALGTTTAELLNSTFVRHLLGDDDAPSVESFETCLTNEASLLVETQFTQRRTNKHPARPKRGGRLQNLLGKRGGVQNLFSLRSAGDSDDESASKITFNHHNSSRLPGTTEIADVIRGDAATLAMLRSIYMQDYLCLPPYYREIGEGD